jgi:hypothetical protein
LEKKSSDISEYPEIKENAVIEMIKCPYDDKRARIHIYIFRELVE